MLTAQELGDPQERIGHPVVSIGGCTGRTVGVAVWRRVESEQ